MKKKKKQQTNKEKKKNKEKKHYFDKSCKGRQVLISQSGLNVEISIAFALIGWLFYNFPIFRRILKWKRTAPIHFRHCQDPR